MHWHVNQLLFACTPYTASCVARQKHAPTLRVLHVSDIHVDLNYTEGAEADCGEPICCRQNSTEPVSK